MKTITANGNAPASPGTRPRVNGTGSVQLHLKVSDPDMYAELSKRGETQANGVCPGGDEGRPHRVPAGPGPGRRRGGPGSR